MDSFAGPNRGHPTLAGPVTEELHLCVHACAYACRLAGMVNLGFPMAEVADDKHTYLTLVFTVMDRLHWT